MCFFLIYVSGYNRQTDEGIKGNDTECQGQTEKQGGICGDSGRMPEMRGLANKDVCLGVLRRINSISGI